MPNLGGFTGDPGHPAGLAVLAVTA